MNELTTLRQYLIKSIQKQGNQPLTLQHLVNIIALIEKKHQEDEDGLEKLRDETLQDMYRYGSD